MRRRKSASFFFIFPVNFFSFSALDVIGSQKDMEVCIMVEMYVSDSLYLNAEVLDEKHWMIHLSNGAEIPVEKDPEHYGSRWGWKIGTQIFSDDKTALRYLERLVTEKLTGKRIVLHAKGEVPEICGVNGAACRAPGECNRALCSRCPVAEKFFADRDGVELVYAVD